ncbi:mannosyltransferase family protein [Rudaeicoccus suwonensis]|uniref:Mannosyltransferase PIG-V n=1 Tax=Rudaeicoccus suwonensis TaxID=657409 RepID=A0A561E3F4_9MICO|nr:mannosyltransferase family protein [Rudaeicoccus suwonensis]TWE10142.1 mannosyltransferase PIG-V [Rudaeicoccus suwonensis]
MSEGTERNGTSRGTPWLLGISAFLVVRAVGLIWLAYVGHRQSKSIRNLLSVWDGKWMLALAQYGYNGIPKTFVDARGLHTSDTAYAFFPGYPWAVAAASHVPGISVFGAAILTSVVSGALASVAAYRIGQWCLLRARPGDHATGERVGLLAAVLFAATPMSIVLTMAYTEALYCALAGWALVMVLERRWVATGVLTLLAGLSRTTVVALIAVVAIAAAIDWWGNRRDWRPLVAIVLSPIGWLFWIFVVAVRTGSPLGWFHVQSTGWNTGFDFGKATIDYLVDTLATNNTTGDVVTAWVILATIALVAIAFASRLPWQVSVYGAAVAFTVLASNGLMNSRARLLLPAYVLLIPVAIGLAHRSERTQLAAGIAVTAVSAWFGAYMLAVYPYAI